MFLQSDIEISASLPDRTSFWMPDEEDLASESLGYFRDTWMICDVSKSEAVGVLIDEFRLGRLVDQVAVDLRMFESLAEAIEHKYSDSLPVDMPGGSQAELLSSIVADGIPDELEGLELGVAGLSYALASVGCFPAASCRGHAKPQAWSDHPVVYAAMDRTTFDFLQPLVHRSGCGFEIDPERPNLLVVEGPSIGHTMSLARRILLEFKNLLTADYAEALDEFNNGRDVGSDQQTLW